MKKYIGTKVILAKPMTRGDFNALKGITADYEYKGEEGYLVKYSDDYESWSPKEAFERAYRSFDGGMPFGSALDLLKMGYKLQRKGWNGKGMWICLAGGVVDNPQSKTNLNDEVVGYLPWIGMKTVDNCFVPWLASQTDMLAEDWIVVE